MQMSGRLDHTSMSFLKYSMGPGRQELTSDAFLQTLQSGTNEGRLLFKVKKANYEKQQFLWGGGFQSQHTLTQVEPPCLTPPGKYKKIQSSKELCDTDQKQNGREQVLLLLFCPLCLPKHSTFGLLFLIGKARDIVL